MLLCMNLPSHARVWDWVEDIWQARAHPQREDALLVAGDVLEAAVFPVHAVARLMRNRAHRLLSNNATNSWLLACRAIISRSICSVLMRQVSSSCKGPRTLNTECMKHFPRSICSTDIESIQSKFSAMVDLPSTTTPR